jgi:hypothetical protein
MQVLRSIAVAALLALGACQESGPVLSVDAGRKVSVGPTVPVAVQSIEGLPDALAPRFSSHLATQAQARDISFVDTGAAPRFRIRGYLNAYAGDGGTTIAWVWDVFDARAQRAQRISGEKVLGRGGADPWSAVDDAALTYVAARSLDEIGGFLAESRQATPMAQAPGRQDQPRASAVD